MCSAVLFGDYLETFERLEGTKQAKKLQLICTENQDERIMNCISQH
jgi:hypothetical protein